jgi:hypothetical protein
MIDEVSPVSRKDGAISYVNEPKIREKDMAIGMTTNHDNNKHACGDKDDRFGISTCPQSQIVSLSRCII